LGCTTNEGEHSSCISPSSADLGSSGFTSVFYGVFRAADVNGIRDSESGDTIMVDEQTLLEVFLNMALRSACFVDIAFFFVW
jgi:hypothetical protein